MVKTKFLPIQFSIFFNFNRFRTKQFFTEQKICTQLKCAIIYTFESKILSNLHGSEIFGGEYN